MHLVVRAEASGFGVTHAYDWIEVIARQGDSEVRACLFPSGHTPSAFRPSEDEHCHERVDEPFSRELEFAEWRLDEGRTINLWTMSDGPITVDVRAGLGRAVVASATVSGVPEGSFPEIVASLDEPTAIFQTETCPAVPGPLVDGAGLFLPSCQLSCLRPAFVDALGILGGVSEAATCDRGTPLPDTGCAPFFSCERLRISNIEGAVPDSCSGGLEKAIWSLAPRPFTTFNWELLIGASFARCADGSAQPGCERTTDCTVPETRIVIETVGASGDRMDHDIGGLSCIPPSLNTLWVSFPVDAELYQSSEAFGARLDQEIIAPQEAATTCALYLDGVSLVLSE